MRGIRVAEADGSGIGRLSVDPDHVRDLFAAFGPVRTRRMFGGTGIYAGDRMFALEADGVLYLKADSETAPDFQAEGSEPFTFVTRKGRRTAMSYWRIPDRLIDDPEELAEWARKALAAAERSATGT